MAIPLISAVGHETDTTLTSIDVAPTRRAPTPTSRRPRWRRRCLAAPRRCASADYQRRLITCGARAVEQRRTRLEAAGRGLPRPQELLEIATQRLDIAAGRLTAGLQRNVAVHAQALAGAAGRLNPRLLQREAEQKQRRLVETSARLPLAMSRRLARDGERLTALGKLHESLDPKGPLRRRGCWAIQGRRAAGALGLGAARRPGGADGVPGRQAATPSSTAPRPADADAGHGPDQGDLF